MAHIQVRIDEKTKKDAMKVFDKLGMDLSGAITVYLRQVIFTQSIPFPIRTVNGFTPEQEQEILREAASITPSSKRYASADELLRDTLGDRWRESTKSKKARNSGRILKGSKKRGATTSKNSHM